MARHAGFGAVASITEDLVNEVISSYVKKSGPYYFPPPLLYTVGTKTVAINAVVEMFPPKVELHANQNDLITVHFSFKSIIIAQVSDLPPPKKWTVQLQRNSQRRSSIRSAKQSDCSRDRYQQGSISAICNKGT